MNLTVGMGEYIVTDNEDAVIKTFALGSCAAVTAYSPLKKVAGMIHIVLPAPLYGMDGKNRPGYFADTGIPLLFDVLFSQYGCSKQELQVQMYGGSESMLSLDIYNIGRQNVTAVNKILFDMGLTVHNADVLGNITRSLTFEVKTGLVMVHRQLNMNQILQSVQPGGSGYWENNAGT